MPKPMKSNILSLLRNIRSQMAMYDFLLPGECHDWPKLPMKRHWFFWERPERISADLEMWAGEMCRARA